VIDGQPKLFSDDVFDAVRTVVAALGGAKAVGSRLRPEKPADDAAKWLAKCLHQDYPEKLDLEQAMLILKWGREANCHVAMQFIAEQCGYECQPLNPEDERQRLQREFIEAQKQLTALAARMVRHGVLPELVPEKGRR
jgi:hypothetical protein